jgi:hypothetical protein
MLHRSIQIHVAPDHLLPAAVDLLLPASFVAQQGIGTHPIHLSFGSATVKVSFQVSPTAREMKMKESIARLLSLPLYYTRYDTRFHAAERTLEFRPILGILVYKRHPESSAPFGNITDFCHEIIETCKARGGAAFVFTLDEIKEQSDNIQGWTYTNQQWVQKTFPLPACVYNRIGSRGTEKREETQLKIAWLKTKNILFFNEKFLDKWQIHQQLVHSSEMAPFLPYTELYKGAASLQLFLQKHPYTYVKPSSGSLGRGIIRITKTTGGYTCEYPALNGNITKRFNSFSDLFQVVRSRIGKRAYVMQQGLHLIKNQGGVVDFRILVQKTHRGEWGITSAVGRSGTYRSIVSNVAQGGTMLSLAKTLALSFPPNHPGSQAAPALRRHSITIARIFEQSVSGHYAELGIDLGVDQSGKVWLLEINSKPSKTNDSLASVSKGPRRSVVCLVDYCFYQSGFPKEIKKKAHTTRRPRRRR